MHILYHLSKHFIKAMMYNVYILAVPESIHNPFIPLYYTDIFQMFSALT